MRAAAGAPVRLGEEQWAALGANLAQLQAELRASGDDGTPFALGLARCRLQSRACRSEVAVSENGVATPA